MLIKLPNRIGGYATALAYTGHISFCHTPAFLSYHMSHGVRRTSTHRL